MIIPLGLGMLQAAGLLTAAVKFVRDALRLGGRNRPRRPDHSTSPAAKSEESK